jgi:glutathione synthase/RimK-type ligase-like ATP-grasp enzyme
MSVLIVTHTEDNICVPAVTDAIRRKGGEVVRFDTDAFPTDVRLVARLDGERESLRLVTADADHDLGAVTAVWHRRLAFGRRLPENMEIEILRACRQESRASAMGMLASLRAFHLDPEMRIRHAEHKQLQLRIAREVGLEVPRTLITNDRAALREFAATCPDGLVAKMLSSFAVHKDGKEQVVFTTRLGPAELESLDGLELSPMTFQECVPKEYELRVTVVGQRVMTCAIDSMAQAGAETDWRRRGPLLSDSWRPAELPADVQSRVLKLMDAFHLNYGAIDFIHTPDGRWVFLEVNPAGEFFWLDHIVDHAISDAMADLLLDKAPRRS